LLASFSPPKENHRKSSLSLKGVLLHIIEKEASKTCYDCRLVPAPGKKKCDYFLPGRGQGGSSSANAEKKDGGGVLGTSATFGDALEGRSRHRAIPSPAHAKKRDSLGVIWPQDRKMKSVYLVAGKALAF